METPISALKYMGLSFRRSRADKSILSGPMWTKFELLLDIMHVPNTYKFKMDQILLAARSVGKIPIDLYWEKNGVATFSAF